MSKITNHPILLNETGVAIAEAIDNLAKIADPQHFVTPDTLKQIQDDIADLRRRVTLLENKS